MLNSIVREAFEASVTWTAPPVSFQSSQLSTVPKASSPASARARAPGTLSSSQAILVAEKYGIDQQSGPLADDRLQAGRFKCWQMAAVRRSCQTMAGAIGRPVSGPR